MKLIISFYKQIFQEGEKWKYRIKPRCNILTDVFVPVQDAISPQKTTLIIPKNEKIKQDDIIVIIDNESGEVEYIGYIDTLSNKENTEISCYPLINYFDNDFVIEQMFATSTNQDGTETDIEVNAVEWLKNQIQKSFIDTDDQLQALPFIIRDMTKRLILHKKVIETSNLFEIYTDLFIEKGIYIKFSGLKYGTDEASDSSYVEGIYCDIYSNTDEKPYNLRWDDPSIQSVDIVDNTFTNYNKLIATEQLAEEDIGKREPQRYYFYLLNDNSITRNPNDGRRIKQVRSKEITFNTDVQEEEGENLTEEEKQQRRANALLLTVHNELQAPEYNLQITITMFNNENIRLYRRVNFTADSGVVYSSNITKIEILNDKQVTVTLGALRNSLTDFKKKVEAI